MTAGGRGEDGGLHGSASHSTESGLFSRINGKPRRSFKQRSDFKKLTQDTGSQQRVVGSREGGWRLGRAVSEAASVAWARGEVRETQDGSRPLV